MMFDSDELRALANDRRYSTVQVASRELLSLLDEYAKLRADAERYRWLRDDAYHAGAGPNGKMVWCVTGEGCSTAEPICGKALEAAIDATLTTPNV